MFMRRPATRESDDVNDKFETDKNKPNQVKDPDWTCFVCLYLFPKESLPRHEHAPKEQVQ
jgi:hypothetical protein